MIGLDTNILIRYITLDDAAQSRKASTLIETNLTEDNPGFISVVVMAEIAWALDRVYGLSMPEIAMTLERLLQINVLVVENEQQVFAATIAVKEGRGSFADALIGGLAANAGCSQTLTFDRKAARLPGFALL